MELLPRERRYTKWTLIALGASVMLFLIVIAIWRATGYARFVAVSELIRADVEREWPGQSAAVSVMPESFFNRLGDLPTRVFHVPAMFGAGPGRALVASRMPDFSDKDYDDKPLTNVWMALAMAVEPHRQYWPSNLATLRVIRTGFGALGSSRDFDKRLGRYVGLKNGAAWGARCILHDLRGGDATNAMEMAAQFFRLIAIYEPDTLLDCLTRDVMVSYFRRSVWELLMSGQLDQDQLADLQSQAATIKVAGPALKALVGETRFESELYGKALAEGTSPDHDEGVLRRLGIKTWEAIASGFDGASAGEWGDAVGDLWWVVGPGYDDVAFYLHQMRRQFPVWEEAVERKDARLLEEEALPVPAMYQVTRGGSGFRQKILRRMFVSESKNVLAIAAIALERFRGGHGAYPESLEDLVPAYLDEVPIDWMDGQPLRYRMEEDGRYRLWSVGKDGVDDGGVPKRKVYWARDNDLIWPRAATDAEVQSYVAERRKEFDKSVRLTVP